MLNNLFQVNNFMNFLCRFATAFACTIMMLNAADSFERTMSDMSGATLDEVNLVTGEIIKGKRAVVAKQQGGDQITVYDVENAFHELSTGRRSDDAAVESIQDNGCLPCFKNSPLTRMRLYYGSAAASWAVSLGLIIYDCGYSACDPSGALMIATYVFAGLGAAFAAGGYCTLSEQGREVLLN